MAKPELLRDAMGTALVRLLDRADPPQDPYGLFAPLAETLFWIAAIDESLFPDPDTRPDLLTGLRYARNRLTHDGVTWDVADQDSVYTERYYSSYTVWVWKRVDELPPDREPLDRSVKYQRPAYVASVQGRAVLDTVRNAVDLLNYPPGDAS